MYEALKQTINTNLPNNTSGAITPALLRNTLLAIISALAEQGQFMGIASTNTQPTIATNGKGWYLAYTAGTYTNFGGTTLSQGDIYIFSYDESTWAYNNIASQLQSRITSINNTLNTNITAVRSDVNKINTISPSYTGSTIVYPSKDYARTSIDLDNRKYGMIINYIYKDSNDQEALVVEAYKGTTDSNIRDNGVWGDNEKWETIKEVTLT